MVLKYCYIYTPLRASLKSDAILVSAPGEYLDGISVSDVDMSINTPVQRVDSSRCTLLS